MLNTTENEITLGINELQIEPLKNYDRCCFENCNGNAEWIKNIFSFKFRPLKQRGK